MSQLQARRVVRGCPMESIEPMPGGAPMTRTGGGTTATCSEDPLRCGRSPRYHRPGCRCRQTPETRRRIWPVLAVLFLAGVAATAPAQTIDLTFEQVEEFLDRIPALMAAASSTRRSEAVLAEARAARWPTVSVSGNTAYLVDPPEGVVIDQGAFGEIVPGVPLPDADVSLVDDPAHAQVSAALTLTWPLITWGVVDASIEAARSAVTTTWAEADLARDEAWLGAHQAYFGAALARDSLAILEQMRAELQQSRLDTAAAFDEGLVVRADLLQVDAGIATMNRQIVEAERALVSATAVIRAYATAAMPQDRQPMPQSARFRLTSGYRTAPELPASGRLTDLAFEYSRERRLWQSRVEAARQALILADRSRPGRPPLVFSARLEASGDTVPLTSSWSDGWDADLILSFGTNAPLWDGGGGRAKVDQARADLTAATETLRQVELFLPVEIARRIEALERARAADTELTARIEYAREQHRSVSVAYANELTTRGEVSQAMVQLLALELEKLITAHSLEVARAGLERLVGPL